MRIFSSKEYCLLIAQLMFPISISSWPLLGCLGSHFSLVTVSQKHSFIKLSYLDPKVLTAGTSYKRKFFTELRNFYIEAHKKKNVTLGNID